METDFLISLLQIIAIDILLGGDNAIVIALASRNLPEHQRNKAIFIGTGLAIIVRIILTVLVVYLLKVPLLYLTGGVLLIYIAFQLLVHDENGNNIKPGMSLISAIRTIVVADIAMGLDNVLAIAGASHGSVQLVVIGLIISVPIIIWGSKAILHMMERFSILIYIGAGILAYTAAGMICSEKELQPLFLSSPHIKSAFSIIIVIGVIAAGVLSKSMRTGKHK
ncbi:TerC family protein [Fictibacillus sp. FJAT-27399]|uniref:TerC family protein n=1 Tax=Fictibacillus sp. FJAT-27399 TaxID=1729689 RepID=UPI000784D88D|nr:TerC family protein [Fictibacillus sp. FJAT-27399]